MELMKNSVTEVLPRRRTGIKDYKVEEGEEDEEEDDGEKKDRRDEEDRTSLKIDLSMAEQFYYEVISSFEQEEGSIDETTPNTDPNSTTRSKSI
uniref:Uncharacterized protein n=1 Tax=Vespula pensylvanica TaxID=30213 RepID=A0A834U3Y0_VESPE|nr:hypothetical protein H0235_012103 [Vespula pensylvanica]